MPISLLHFTASATNGNVVVEWTTATEINSNYFEVERSNDGKTFAAIANIPAAGFNTTELNYSSIDQNPFSGVSYYRLKEVDMNGKENFSNIKSVQFCQNANNVLITSNPGSSYVSCVITSSENENASIQILNSVGMVVYSSKQNLYSGANMFSIDETNLASGIYLFVVNSATNISAQKILVQH